MTTNNRRTHRNNHRTRKNTRTRVVATKLLLIIVTLVVMVSGTISVGKVGMQIAGTQFRMLYYYNSIQNCESQRDYYQELAYTSQGEARRAMQAQADSFDASIGSYMEKRNSLARSTDPVVAFAAKNQFDFLMLLLGVSCFAVIALVWCFVYRHFVEVIETEFKIFNLVVSSVFMCLDAFFYVLHRNCYKVAVIFGKRPKKRKHVSRNDSSNIVPFKRVG